MGDTITDRMVPLSNKLTGLANLFNPQDLEGRNMNHVACMGIYELLEGIAVEIMDISEELDEKLGLEKKAIDEGEEG